MSAANTRYGLNGMVSAKINLRDVHLERLQVIFQNGCAVKVEVYVSPKG